MVYVALCLFRIPSYSGKRYMVYISHASIGMKLSWISIMPERPMCIVNLTTVVSIICFSNAMSLSVYYCMKRPLKASVVCGIETKPVIRNHLVSSNSQAPLGYERPSDDGARDK